jgi:hypothetical protein
MQARLASVSSRISGAVWLTDFWTSGPVGKLRKVHLRRGRALRAELVYPSGVPLAIEATA